MAVKKVRKVRISFAEILFNCFFIKNYHTKPHWQVKMSFTYAILLAFLPIYGFIPIFAAFKPELNLSWYFLGVFIIACIFIVDYVLKIIVNKYYYDMSMWKLTIRKQMMSFWSNLQFITSVTMILLLIIFGDFVSEGIDIIRLDSKIMRITTTILLLINFSSIYSRFVIFTANTENIRIFKRIFLSQIKNFIFAILTIILIVLLFAFIILMIEEAWSEDPKLTNMGDAIYYAFIVMTTIGFGDITVANPVARTFTIILGLTGICFYAYLSSIFVNIFVEFINKKKNIQMDAKQTKDKDNDTQYMLSQIDNIVVKNLYEVGLIPQDRYEMIIQKRAQLEQLENYEYKLEDFRFEYKPFKKVYFMTSELGIYNQNPSSIKQAEEAHWFAVRYIPDTVHKTVLYLLPHKLINEIKLKSSQLPIFFSSKITDTSINRLVIYQKKPFKAGMLEMNIQAVLRLDKDEAWKTFGKSTNMTKANFEGLFSKTKKVSVVLVKDIIVYSKFRLLESYGINSGSKINDVIYLK